MSEPIKLDASEVEFWKECVVAGLRHDAEPIAYQATCEPPGLWAVALSDAAVVALRERTMVQTSGRREWRECDICGKKLDASALLPKSNFICCGNTMLVRP